MANTMRFGQWLRYLGAPGASPARRRHAAADTVMRNLVALARGHMQSELDAIVAAPITVSDDGTVRVVRAFRAVEYGYDRARQTCFANLREADGAWLHLTADDYDSVAFDPCLPLRPWRRRIRYALMRGARDTLTRLVEACSGDLDVEHRSCVHRLCDDIVVQAWCGLHMRDRLTALFPTKAMRQAILDAMDIDPALLRLAHACRLRSRYRGIGQQWLTFAWQHRETLERIRVQTPGLLATVAAHMFRHGAADGCDPTRECTKWLIGQGVSRRSFRLLTLRSARPFREVTARWPASQSLDALVLALRLSESGHDAEAPQPMFYRVTLDQFDPSMTAWGVQKLLATVPARVFIEARQRLRQAANVEAADEVSLEYRAILDWWSEDKHLGHQDASWSRWLALARIAEARRRATLDMVPWPCALEELSTPTAQLLALSNPLSLFEEGQRMRHCAYVYVDKCRQDRVRLFSARMRHQGHEERATIGLQRGSRGWRIWDIRGACNRRMGGHWIPVARQLAEVYGCRDGAGQLPLPVAWHFAGGDPFPAVVRDRHVR